MNNVGAALSTAVTKLTKLPLWRDSSSNSMLVALGNIDLIKSSILTSVNLVKVLGLTGTSSRIESNTLVLSF